MPTAFITGASSGIGRAFAGQLAAQGYDLTLVARTTASLDPTAAALRRSGRQVRVLAADLVTDTGINRVTAALESRTPDLLINSAGMGLGGAFPFTNAAAEEAQVRLNVVAVMRTTHAALPGMLRRNTGAVVNVTSVAACGPAWLASTYPASKSWVLSFTESIARSATVRRSGVHLMAVLPGYTRTAFHTRAGMGTDHLPAWMWLSADQVASDALRDLSQGRLVSIPSWRYKAAVWGMRHLPHRLTAALGWDFSTGRGAPAEPPGTRA
ncbi:SDR family oxidoreductase [Streptomyces pactum]|uniref:Short-chain dehydrogenase n=1 Tax=Streptomyces pactum TaxID=68249 RepID=A0A1S6JIG8_9ACTN|nr:SDR family NAD(P)-dependent oxidoreductase [Streptomyces pactum]AQS71553.1 hypothetical protein B1H29_36070 [Streptomyces pactum]